MVMCFDLFIIIYLLNFAQRYIFLIYIVQLIGKKCNWQLILLCKVCFRSFSWPHLKHIMVF